MRVQLSNKAAGNEPLSEFWVRSICKRLVSIAMLAGSVDTNALAAYTQLSVDYLMTARLIT